MSVTLSKQAAIKEGFEEVWEERKEQEDMANDFLSNYPYDDDPYDPEDDYAQTSKASLFDPVISLVSDFHHLFNDAENWDRARD